MIKLREADPTRDQDFLYGLLAERPIYANISHGSLPLMEQHITFVRSHPYHVWYIIEVDGKPVGSIYLTKRALPSATGDEIGIAIKAEHQRKGIAREAITELMRLHWRWRFLANVAATNKPSQELFEGLGFKLVQHTYELRPFG